MLELLPGIGMVLPDGAGTLRFGMTPDEAEVMLKAAPRSHRGRQCMTLARADYKELRHAHDAWLIGILFDPAWSTCAVFDGVTVTVAGGGPGLTDRLTSINIGPDPSSGAPSATPVVWDGVDLFGHPVKDVVSVLPEPVRPSLPAVTSPPTTTEVTVEPLGLRLSENPSAADRWSRLTLLGTPTGWETCCAGTFACAGDGDGLVGILRY
ncbi:hypothetical protein PUR49_03460 [Streptomyces sp. BE147]|uniref:hypothetical protein n=1 Tax=Streptomyces sp. BE147 TaxID=3002524 RepID=UPI002E7913FD|nr:hypothetical protein [Streptomyces sp. BE147]MEE1735584.1 hypothetical protein [Streptomyces sp. BE147]